MAVSKPFKRGKRWYVSVRHEGKQKQIALGVTDEKKAINEAGHIAREIDRGTWKIVEQVYTLDSFMAAYEKHYKNKAGQEAETKESRENSWRTDSCNLRAVMDFLKAQGVTKLTKVSVKHAEQFRDARMLQPCGKREGLSVETVRKDVRVAKAAWNWAMRQELVLVNPWTKITFPKRKISDPRNLSHLEARQALEAAARHPRADLLKAVGLGLYAGLRLAEIMRLDYADLVWGADGFIRVRAGKDREPRTTLFPAELQAILTPYKTTAGPVVTTYNDKRILGNSVRDLGAAFPSPWSLHDLRRSFASLLAERGVSTTRIRDYLGHTSVATTEGYYLRRNHDAVAAHGLSFGLPTVAESGASETAPSSKTA